MVVSGSFEAGVIAAKEAVDKGAEMIISCGGTAQLIAAAINVPVVEIKVTVLDVLNALGKVKPKKSLVGIAGFPNVIYGCEKLLNFCKMPLQVINLENHSEAKEKILTAAHQGIRVIVGDSISVETAIQLGLQGILIQSDKNSISQAIKEAQLIVGVRRNEQERFQLLKIIIESSTDGIISIDSNNRINIFNPMAEEIFQMPAAQAIAQPVTAIIPNTRLPQVIAHGISEIGDIQYIGSKVIATKRIPIKIGNEVVGAVANFQDITQLQRYEQDIRQKLYAKGLTAKVSIDEIIGTSAALTITKERARLYGATDSTILITGESGTGKEMFAQSIHNLSKRKNGPFVAINCAALPDNLLESELFGYEEGAFTGARKGGKPGLLELAHNGTVFLDEISEMHLILQSRLLRVLQEKEVMRLGGDRVIPIDVRYIAATNQNLDELVANKQFRQDLYYRLNILRVHVPPLRERTSDIPALAEYFIKKFNKQHKKDVTISAGIQKILKKHRWPGNVREFANSIERAVLLATGNMIGESCIRQALFHDHDVMHDEAETMDTNILSNLEHHTITKILAEEGFNYTKTANRLGINRTTLWRKLHKLC
ncbi:PAS domain S-box-containing protein [Sporomusa malonica]|uniref:PAS domain S-box-containing protein n=2 Tax=Sporomusa malonica TaxID=112901 RepID=A0A1W1Y7K2_9FIRM|nr:PAS domain S-box-containing protein [Sporomusa malonica]